MLSVDRLKNFKKINNPFPLMLIDNFLNEEEANEAIKTLQASNFDEIVNEGRKNIRMGTPNFSELMQKRNIINEIQNFFNKKQTFQFLYSHLLQISNESKENFYIKELPNNFNQKFFEYKRSIHKANFSKRLINYLNNKFLFLKKLEKNFFYLETNYSIATKGYKLPTHTDKKTRILVFLLYLNDLKKSSGGGLEIYSQKDQIDKKNFSLECEFQPQCGRLIAFLSNPISFHNVGSIFDKSQRYFCYGGYTSNKNLDWLK